MLILKIYIMSKFREAITEFVEKWCDEVNDMSDHRLELLMDDHRCIEWDSKEYFIQKENSFWTDDENAIAEYLINKFSV